MSWKIILLALFIAQLTPQPPNPPRHDKYKDDPRAYCMAGQPMPNDKHGHECHCKLMCSSYEDEEGNIVIPEDNTCELWCTKSRCVCHSDEQCPT